MCSQVHARMERKRGLCWVEHMQTSATVQWVAGEVRSDPVSRWTGKCSVALRATATGMHDVVAGA